MTYKLSVLLRGIVVICGLAWLFLAYAFLRALVSFYGVLDGPILPISCLMLVPAFLMLITSWRIFAEIGHNRGLTIKNARRLRRFSHYALMNAILAALLTVCTLAGNMSTYATGQNIPFLSLVASGLDGDVVLFLLIASAGFAATVIAGVLSHLTLKAAGLQDENDFMI